MATLTETIGRVLSGRYRIEAALGTGASAHVYVATDVSLKRRVAIKMLHPVLAADRSFLKRFRAEAQAAASLTHPNLVAVYDWGENSDGPYLVLEYLGGGSLRDVLDAGHALEPSQVASIGAQAAHGLAYAHARGFVHRDVKPANLLFDDDRRRLCVADFGLARALAEAAWTEPVGATLGTARYAAPEQAQGKRVDGRADVYALALVLYEALTQTVPFSADTTIGTLMARVDAPLPGHPALGPLEAILRAAAAPDAEERLSAAELARRLSQVARELPPGGALPEGRSRITWRPYDDLSNIGAGPPAAGAGSIGTGAVGDAPTGQIQAHDAGPNGAAPNGTVPNGMVPNGTARPFSPDEISDDGRDAWAIATAMGVAADPPRVAAPETKATSAVSDVTEIGAPGQAGLPGAQLTAEEIEHERRAADKRSRREKRAEPQNALEAVRSSNHRRRWPWVVVALVIVLAGAGAGGILAARHYQVFTPSYNVPPLTGLTASEAAGAVSKDGFHVTVTGHRYDVKAPSGSIVSQDPVAGKAMKRGARISVVTSAGPPPVNVPSLASVTGGCPSVKTVLASVNLVAVCSETTSITVKAGQVISYSPRTTAIYGTKVGVVVSTGLPQVAVPNLSGMDKAQATAALEAHKFVPALATSQYSSTVPDGEVLPGWTGEGKTLLYGSTVTLAISLGHAPVRVPNVSGMSEAAAEAELEADGFAIAYAGGPPGATKAYDTSPAAGAVEPWGTSIDLYLH